MSSPPEGKPMLTLRKKAFIWGLLGFIIMSAILMSCILLTFIMAILLLTQDGFETLSTLRSKSPLASLFPWQEKTFLFCTCYTVLYMTAFYLYKSMTNLMLMMGFHCLSEKKACRCCGCLIVRLVVFSPIVVTGVGTFYCFPPSLVNLLLVAPFLLVMVKCDKVREQLWREDENAFKYLPILWNEQPAYELVN